MARYNTSSSTNTISGTATIGSPFQGAFTEFTGSAPYTVTLPAVAAFPGINQTFYNATGGLVTLSTPSGNFVGTGATNASTFVLNSGNVVSVVSDGTNYIVLSEDGSPLIATTGSFSGDVSMSGGTATVTISPQSLTLNPTSGVINNTSIGGTTRSSGAFTTLAANQAVTFSAGTASSSTTTGSLVVTGGVGVSGTVTAGTVNATNLGGTLSTVSQPNVTGLGTLGSLTVSGTGTIGVVNATNYLRTAVHATKSIDLGYFPNTTANQAIDIRFGNNYINGNIEVEVTSSYSYQNATGILRKSISIGANPGSPGGFWYGPSSRIVEALGSVVDNFYIGDLEWDTATSQFRITIYHTTSTGNPCIVNIKMFGTTAVDNVAAITTSAQYTRTAPSPSRQYVNYNESVGIGTANPDALFHVKSGAVGTFFKMEGTTGRYVYSGIDGGGQYIEQVGTAANERILRIQNSNGSGTYTQLFFDGANQQIYTNTAASVGIGMTNPQTVLHVSGTNKNIFLDNFGVGQTGLKLRYQTSSVHGAGFLYTPNDATAYIENNYAASSGTVYGDIYFRQNIGGTMTTRLTIKADGGLISTSNDFKVGGQSSARSQRVQMGTYSAYTTSGDSNTYWHFKTSIKANRDVTMQAVIAEGFAYGNATLIDCRWGWHTDSSGNLYSKAYLTNGPGPSASNLYVAADGYTVVVLYVSSTYYSSVTFRYIQSEMYGETQFSITNWTRTTSASGAF
jgi:hypothetical protein